MKNILGTKKDLSLFGSDGELRYEYFSNELHIWEIRFDELGKIVSRIKIKK
tara:strand:+ start:323 stop:475 length:153 start_codon:yes stop_codon:yes gene_type:complete